MTIKANNFVSAFFKLAKRINQPHLFKSEDIRINNLSDTFELLNVSIECECNNINRVSSDVCMFSDRYYLMENLWYAFGDENANDIAKYAGLWRKMMNKNGEVRSNYGYTIREYYRFNQLQSVITLLKKEPESRRAVIYLNNTVVPYKTKEVAADIPCTNTLQFFVRNHKLHLMVNMRSNDMIFGIRYDVPFFMMLQQIVAHELGIPTGKYYHTANSLHVYKKHLPKLQSLCDKDNYDKVYTTPNLVSLWTNIDTELIYHFINGDELIDKNISDLFLEILDAHSKKYLESTEVVFNDI